ncbi:hypothetical protein [Phaeobacter sp. HF9A]|uniref:hypothetical protein n=1 Tax=Phaeobacter sp. HF9A TaxID=2721561 RepID=UPI0034C5DD77
MHRPLDALGESHGLTPRSALMYERFFGLQAVAQSHETLGDMLAGALAQAVAALPAEAPAGRLIYCRTQTHNTLSDRNWLRRLADDHGLEDWEVSALTLTSCASALVQMHVARLGGLAEGQPMIILTGEKAFHPSVSRLPVGLLAEIPAAALFNAGPARWHLVNSHLRHLSRFHQNPDRMSGADRKALQECYAPEIISFIEQSLARYDADLAADMVFLPHNLNRPVTDAILRHFDWQDRCFHGDLAQAGHAYCSDGFANLAAFEAAGRKESQVLMLAAGTGVTFATCLFNRNLSEPE